MKKQETSGPSRRSSIDERAAGVAGFAFDHQGVDGGERLFARVRDDDAFAAGEAVGFQHDIAGQEAALCGPPSSSIAARASSGVVATR